MGFAFHAITRREALMAAKLRHDVAKGPGGTLV